MDERQKNSAKRELVVTSVYTEAQLRARAGQAAYSYRIVFRAFRPLLEKWAPTTAVDDPGQDLAGTAAAIRARGGEPVHLSFLPLHDQSSCPDAVNIGVPAWEFPDLPNEDLQGDSRQNWVRRAADLDLIITHTNFSREAFLKAGVTTPVRVVPVPVNPIYFDVPPWEPGRRTVIDVPCHALQSSNGSYPIGDASRKRSGQARPRSVASRSAGALRRALKRALPERAAAWLSRVKRSFAAGRQTYRQGGFQPADVCPRLELDGVVYTSIFAPGDTRKNWRDMVTGFLYALGDRPDATLVFKLVVSPDEQAFWVREVTRAYRAMHVRHRCKLVLVTAFLTDEQMQHLVRASTYYLNASKAEGSCLPLQDYMAAGRPAVAPANTGMADSLGEDGAFLVDSHPEPAAWPQDPRQRLTTTWHRLNWQSLHDQLRESYRVATSDLAQWRAMSAAARRRMRELVAPERVWPLLRRALDEAVRRRSATGRAA